VRKQPVQLWFGDDELAVIDDIRRALPGLPSRPKTLAILAHRGLTDYLWSKETNQHVA
jgi:hypothetical protein